MLVELSAATLGAPQSALDIDVAELLVACTVRVGPERALRDAIDAAAATPSGASLPYLQRAALTPHLRDLARCPRGRSRRSFARRRGRRDRTGDARSGADAPDPPEGPAAHGGARDFERVPADQQARVDRLRNDRARAEQGGPRLGRPSRSCSRRRRSSASGIAVRGAVTTPACRSFPCVVLQSAIKFVNRTVPSSAGRIGMSLRFLQRLGRRCRRRCGRRRGRRSRDDRAGRAVPARAAVRARRPATRTSSTGPSQQPSRRCSRGRPRRSELVLVLPFRSFARRWCLLFARRSDGLCERRPRPGEAAGALRRQHRRLSCSTRSRSARTCLAYRRAPEPGRARRRQHCSLDTLEPDPRAGRDRRRRGEPLRWADRVGRRSVPALAIAITQRLCTFYLPPIWGYDSLRWLTRKGYV